MRYPFEKHFLDCGEDHPVPYSEPLGWDRHQE